MSEVKNVFRGKFEETIYSLVVKYFKAKYINKRKDDTWIYSEVPGEFFKRIYEQGYFYVHAIDAGEHHCQRIPVVSHLVKTSETKQEETDIVYNKYDITFPVFKSYEVYLEEVELSEFLNNEKNAFIDKLISYEKLIYDFMMPSCKEVIYLTQNELSFTAIPEPASSKLMNLKLTNKGLFIGI